MSPSLRHSLIPTTLYAALALSPLASAGFGNSFYLGPWTGGAYIKQATYSLAAPKVITNYDTSDSSLWIAIWVGVQQSADDVDNENLVQPLLNWCADQESCGCDASATEWCVTASTYTPEGQTGGAYVPVPKGAALDFEISVNSSTSMIDQKVWLNGELVSQQSDSKGMKPGVIYSANECSSSNCGTLASFSWTDVKLVMSKAVTDLDAYMSYDGASSDGLTSSDGGITWTADAIAMGKDTTWDL
ncbi:hypothetical protein VMCG_10266 [Cytospora schulzeri]|uniref:Concanavalin A-like lectin/glucanase n=1 Tax=Cytospora schulzeri TaxID=448051 RepID=A0A423VGV4_9PEZI|nr:hypothetical protein VMCG_10266 [Valsa malicola]